MAMFESTSPLAFDQELFDDPFKAIEFFFSLDNLTGHKTYLKKWYKMALSEAHRLNDFADYFFLYNQFTKLLNAGYLIANKKLIYQEALSEGLTTKDRFITNEVYNKGLCEVNALPAEHIENPYRFVASFFVPEKIKQLRLGLLEWLYAAFSTGSSIKLMDKEFLFEQYETMLMIVEAFFLMIGNPSLSDDIKDERRYYAE